MMLVKARGPRRLLGNGGFLHGNAREEGFGLTQGAAWEEAMRKSRDGNLDGPALHDTTPANALEAHKAVTGEAHRTHPSIAAIRSR